MGEQDDTPLSETDLILLRSLRTGNEWLRSLLCTLARRGLALQRDDPARATAILDSLATYPFYKAGQFLFDLMEWEDFMLDGPTPAIMATALDPRALQRLTKALNQLRAQLDGDTTESPLEVDISSTQATHAGDVNLPALEASQYLYQYVALGAWLSAERSGSEITTL